jgi:hypothetical protein
MAELFKDGELKPEALFDNALNSLGKKTAASVWGKFKRQLSTATQPFFRKDMGERYLSSGSLSGGAMLWGVATLAALMLPGLRSAATPLCHLAGLYRLAHLFHHWLPTVLAGGALVFFHIKFGRESIALMAKYRADGTAYHTQSRGTPRWGKNGFAAGSAITFALFLFNMPAGILFAVSCAVSAKLASEQEAAIYARYLDALDQKIEQEYLESAILGKCPTEITQLTKPLPAHMNADLRNNIAAAAVGRSVKIVAKGPRSPGSQGPAGNPADMVGSRTGVSPLPGDMPMAVATHGQSGAAPDSKSNKTILIAVIIGILAVAACAAIRYWPAQPRELPSMAATRPGNGQAAPVVASGNGSKAVAAQPAAQDPSKVCEVNVKQIVSAFRSWSVDNDGAYPFNLPKNKGGTKEFCSVGSDGFDRGAAKHLQAMPNELSTPRILVCPADSSRTPASDFQHLEANNVTYQIRSGAGVCEANPKEVIVRCPIHGFVGLCDGSVQKN